VARLVVRLHKAAPIKGRPGLHLDPIRHRWVKDRKDTAAWPPMTPERRAAILRFAAMPDEDLFRVDTAELDRAAFGVDSERTVQIPIAVLKPLRDDHENARHAVGLKPHGWVPHLKEPIDVKLKGGVFHIDDGHHRYETARRRGMKALPAVVSPDDNPIVALRKLAGTLRKDAAAAPPKPTATSKERKALATFLRGYFDPDTVAEFMEDPLAYVPDIEQQIVDDNEDYIGRSDPDFRDAVDSDKALLKSLIDAYLPEHEGLRKGVPIKGRPGLHLDPMKHRWIRDSDVKEGAEFKVPLYGQPRRVRVHAIEGDTAHLETGHAEGGWGRKYRMPLASVPHHVNDLRGVVPKQPPSGRADVDQVLAGNAEHIGKGHDGVVWKAGNRAVKASTTTPYVHDNPGHRTPKQAHDHLSNEHYAHEALAGLPHVPEIEGGAHGGRYWLSKPWWNDPGKLTRAELVSVQHSIEAMHARGWTMNDQIQLGRDNEGGLHFMDLGQASDGSTQHRREGDREHLDALFRDHGEKRLPIGEELVKKEEMARRMAFKLVPKALSDGKIGSARKWFDRWHELAAARRNEFFWAPDDEAMNRYDAYDDAVSATEHRLKAALEAAERGTPDVQL